MYNRLDSPMLKISLVKSRQDLIKCFSVIIQLRTTLSELEFIKRVEDQKKEGYMIAYGEDKGKVVALAGFRVLTNLVHGKFLYIDDLITDQANRSKGYGDTLFNWLITYAKKENCKQLHLDSGIQRFEAHRFYFRKRMAITAHHFGLTL